MSSSVSSRPPRATERALRLVSESPTRSTCSSSTTPRITRSTLPERAVVVPALLELLSASSSPARSAVAWPAAQAAASSVLLSPSPLAAIGAPVQQRRASSSGGGTQSSWYIHEGQDAASPGGQASVGGSSLHTILANARREREIAADEALARQMQAQEVEAAAAAVGPGAHGRRRGRRQ